MKQLVYYSSSFIIASILLFCTTNNSASPMDESTLVFENEQQIVIDGYSGYAMEPFISHNGNFLFFNSLNNGINTSLYYAEKQSDTFFIFKGEVIGANVSTTHLDAVASMDNKNIFYFISTRNYPEVLENLQSGIFSKGGITKNKPVQGNFYIRTPGWIIMDAEISRDGYTLYYVNARFEGNPFPTEAILGIAEKKDSQFLKSISSGEILKHVNNSQYLVYAPSISSDELELYFTRIKKGTHNTEICVTTRRDQSVPFGKPMVIPLSGNLPEAPSIAADGKRLYYHKKSEQDGQFHIFMMERK